MRPALLRTVAFAALATTALAGMGARADGPEPLFRVVKDGKWGFIDRAGSVVIAPAFDAAGPFSEGLAAVRRGKTHGYVDRSGKLVLVPRQEPAGAVHRRFSSGRAAVKVNALLGYIDATGTVVIPARYRRADDFSEGYALACDPKLGCGYVDVNGRGVIGPGLMGGSPVRGGLACTITMMSMSRQTVALQLVGGRRLPDEYAGCGSPAESLVAVRVGDRWGYVDRDGKAALPLAYAWAGDFAGGLAPARDASGACGYVDRTGAFVIPPRWRTCDAFAGDLARVDLATVASDAEHWAFVDRSGAVVIDGAKLDPPFDSAAGFVDGLAAVAQGGEPNLAGPDGPLLGYVNTSGRWVWRPSN
jgi:hypothetical protein